MLWRGYEGTMFQYVLSIMSMGFTIVEGLAIPEILIPKLAKHHPEENMNVVKYITFFLFLRW